MHYGALRVQSEILLTNISFVLRTESTRFHPWIQLLSKKRSL